jgi:hypothetical protein
MGEGAAEELAEKANIDVLYILFCVGRICDF